MDISPLSTYTPSFTRVKSKPLSSSDIDPKLYPADPLTSRLGWAQSLVYSCPKRHRFLVAGRRFGKSHLSISEVKRTALDPNSRPLPVRKLYPQAEIKYFYPTYKQAKDVIWEPLKRLTEPWWVKKPNNVDLQIYLQSQSGYTAKVTLAGVDVDPDKQRGGGLDLAIFDECAFMSNLDAVRTVIKPSLAERVGRELYITSPNSYNESYTLYNSIVDGKSGYENYAAFQFTTMDGGRVPEAEIENDRRTYSLTKFRQEYLATFETTKEGVCYHSFDNANILSTPVPFNPYSPLVFTIDLNRKPLTGVLLQKWEPTGFGKVALDPSEATPASRFYVLDEIYLDGGNATTYDLMEAFAAKTSPWLRQVRGKMSVWFYGDASMSGGHTSSRHSDHEIVAKWFQGQDRYEFIDQVPRSNPQIPNRIEAVNSFLCNAAYERKLYLNPQCDHLIQDLRRVVWADNMGLREDQTTDRSLTHISSALGYYIHPISEFAGTVAHYY